MPCWRTRPRSARWASSTSCRIWRAAAWLAVNSSERMALFPDIPTLNELRPGERYRPSWFGLFAPAGTPREIVEKIADVTGKILVTPGFGDKTFRPAGQKLDDFRKFIAEDRAIAQRIVKDLGVEPQ